MLPFQVDPPVGEQPEGKMYRRKWPFQLDSPLYVGDAGVKFREGCCHFNLTHPFLWAMQGQNLEKEVALPT